MNDHNASITIKFNIYGRQFDCHTSINYVPNGDDIDDRIVDWFADAYENARANWDHQNMVEDERRAAEALEKTERAELARLKTKYEPLANIPVPDQDFDWRPHVVRSDAPASPYEPVVYAGQGFARIGIDGSGVRWRNPTPAGVYGTHVSCKECGRVVTIKLGEMISQGDPRLCEHLGGPPSIKDEGE